MMDSEVTAKEQLPQKNIIKGSVLILISNLIYISNNYIVAWTELKATEVVLVRGCLQVILFGVVVGIQWRKKTEEVLGLFSHICR